MSAAAERPLDSSLSPAQVALLDREAGLRRQLTPRQLSMIALGGAIGTGLFLGSAISVRLAGPGAILSYAAGGLIALALMWALADRKSTRLNSSHIQKSRMPSSA